MSSASRVQRRLTGSLVVLMGFQLLTSLAAITLSSRRSAELERVQRETSARVTDVEVMLASLAGAPLDPERARATFMAALEQAERCTAEGTSSGPLATLRRLGASALAGDRVALGEAVAALTTLGDEHRVVGQQLEREAHRLQLAGAWAAALLGIVGVWAAMSVGWRLRRYVVDPLAELHRTVLAVSEGEPRRRCSKLHLRSDLGLLIELVNEALDRLEHRAAPPSEAKGLAAGERAALLRLLDAQPEPALVVGPDGELLAVGARALELFDAADGRKLRAAIRAACVPSPEDAGGAGPDGSAGKPGDASDADDRIRRVVRLEPSGAWLCWLGERPASAGAGTAG